MTGNLIIGNSNGELQFDSPNIDSTTAPSSAKYGGAITVYDANGNRLFYNQLGHSAADTIYRSYVVQRQINGENVQNGFYIAVAADGTPSVTFTSGAAAAWRSGLGMADWPTLSYDSGWKAFSFSSAFENYGTDHPMQYRRVGNVVELRGVCKPTAEIAAGGSATIGTLPAGYRPSDTVYQLCQGSGKNTWLCSINSSGAITFARYGGEANVAAGTGVWLPFTITYLVD